MTELASDGSTFGIKGMDCLIAAYTICFFLAHFLLAYVLAHLNYPILKRLSINPEVHTSIPSMRRATF
jgi:predicted PurR-regulated permease PerM